LVLSENVTNIVKRIALRRGYKFKIAKGGNTLQLIHPEAPLTINIVLLNGAAEVRLVYDEKLIRDYLGDVVEAEEDPRSTIEELMDAITMVANEVAQELSRMGLKVKIYVRDAVMDILEMLEDLEEL